MWQACQNVPPNFGVKFIYSEKATKNLRNLHLFLTGSSTSQKKVEISQIFCGLLRIYELYMNQNNRNIRAILYQLDPILVGHPQVILIGAEEGTVELLILSSWIYLRPISSKLRPLNRYLYNM